MVTGTHLAATVARDAVELLAGPFAHRIRTCAAEDCHLIYVDASRPGRRRWCSMEHQRQPPQGQGAARPPQPAPPTAR
ncbi:CGNR zinc finger domain-containing protein [Amycolatopsis vastitatis]|uniref:CGNR zinc finger domain-containing protein n=1 Tax=Amycolatopsis vastitatis TaxID=1905142 RepID=UPI0030842404